MHRPSSERTSITWKTFISRTASRPATAITSVSDSHPAIHNAAMVLDGVVVMRGEILRGGPVSATSLSFATAKSAGAAMQDGVLSRDQTNKKIGRSFAHAHLAAG